MTTTLRTPARSKVPEITALFWVIKVLTTGMGETASDYLGNNLPIIIFVTAHDEYALRAFEAGALDYLLKPFDGGQTRFDYRNRDG